MTTTPTDPSQVLKALASVADPETGRSLVQLDQIQNIQLSPGKVSLRVGLTSFSAPLWDEVLTECRDKIRAALGEVEVAIERTSVERPAERIGQIGLPVKCVIAVGSGKGGVGKSTMAASLAYGLKRAGAKVGLMDADVYGPSVPHLLGLHGRAQADNGRILPVDYDGMQVMSMGFFVPPGEAVVWRGPMLHGAITQFLRDTNWSELDYLIIDMPPGTGDIAITLSQLLPLSGAVVVCTPQDVALLDAVKAIAMFRKVNIPVLGMIENMSYFLCPDNGKRYDIFGHGGAKQRATELDVPFLGEVPINIQIRVNGDQGQLAGNFSDAESGPHFETICRNLVRGLAESRRENPPLPTLSVL